MRESEVQKYLFKRGKAMGAKVEKMKYATKKDCPDCLVLWSGVSVWVEVKATGKKPRASQLREHARMRATGAAVAVVDSFESVDNLLDHLTLVSERLRMQMFSLSGAVRCL